MHKKRVSGKYAQVSVEYLIIVGFALVLVLGAGYFAVISYSGFSDSVTIKQSQKAAQTIVETANVVYAYGDPTFVTAQIAIPQDVDSIIIQANEVTFRVLTSLGTTDVTAYATVNLSGTLLPNAGRKDVRISTNGTHVLIA